MNDKNYLENIEDHWERLKEDILSNTSEKIAFKIDLLIDSMENDLSVIKAELANSTDKPKRKSVVTEDNSGNNEEIDIERIIYRIQKCSLWLDSAISPFIYLYRFKEEDIRNEEMFLNFLKSQDIDFEKGNFTLIDDVYASYVQFKAADIPVIKEKLKSFIKEVII